ncbi:hypothetical protein ACH5RR_024689 [Cinchona calisaya]|uniref:DNA-3-methyladenine glycosylase I n=1 Tax=Cinchona calisaya TaxID=153742 RepID=A0ABD2Z0L9_9GENT
MSGPPRVRSMNQAESEVRPVLGPAGNKARSALEQRKPVSKPKVTVNKMQESDEKKSPATVTAEKDLSPSPKKRVGGTAATILSQQRQEVKSFLMRSNLSMNASCSSDASTDSSRSRASTGRISRRSVTPIRRKQQCGPKIEKVEKLEKVGSEVENVAVVGLADDSVAKKRCAWVTPNTDSSYATFHDEEWGVPVHEDKKLFELLSLSTSLAELTWPTILRKRNLFREIFQDFDPAAVSKLNEKKVAAPGSPASSLLSELKIRAIVENARQACKIIEELGSFEKYIWGFVNYKPIVGHFRYPRQVPIKTSKADAISKDLVRRGFRGIGPTVVYSFMQVAGITNDHLVSCFRFQDCIDVGDGRDEDDDLMAKVEGKQPEDSMECGLERTLDGLGLSA